MVLEVGKTITASSAMQLNIKAIINVYACYIVVMVGIGLIRILPSPDQKLVNLDVGETFPVVVPYH